MQSDIYNTLSDNARKLVNQIEKRVGYEIQVQPKSARKDGWISEVSDENVVGVVSGPDSIVIESPGGVGDIAEVDFIHERYICSAYTFLKCHTSGQKNSQWQCSGRTRQLDGAHRDL